MRKIVYLTFLRFFPWHFRKDQGKEGQGRVGFRECFRSRIDFFRVAIAIASDLCF